jgi:hypothetical protein
VLGQHLDRIEVVDRHREEPMHLRRSERHGEHAGGTRGCQQVCHEPGADGDAGASFLSERAYAKCGITAVMWAADVPRAASSMSKSSTRFSCAGGTND